MSEPKETQDGVPQSATMAPAGGALTTVTDGGLMVGVPQYAPPAYGPTADPLAGGVDFVRVWHAIRRRWLPATAAGLALGTAAALAAWLTLPKGYEAIAWLRVRSSPGTFSGAGIGDYNQYRKTQLQLIKSPFVLNAALRQPGIAALEVLREETDQVSWLERNVQVATPAESEVVQIKMRGPNPREITQVVNAVTKAYLTDVVNKEKTERLARRDMLEKKYKENQSEIRTRLETFNNLARSLGSRDSAEVSTQRSLLLDHLGTVRASLVSLQRDLARIDTELALIDATSRMNEANPNGSGDDMIDAMLMRHPAIADIAGRISSLEETISFQAERSARGLNDPSVKRLLVQRDELLRRLETQANELRPEVAAQVASQAATRGPGGAVVNPMILKMRREILAKQLEETSKEFDGVAKEVTALGNANADLEARRHEIQQLQAVTNQMGLQLNASEVDIAMPNRVELIEEAAVPGSADDVFRTMLTILAALGGLGVGFSGVILLEYLRGRLASADEVSQRIGLRVIGTVPLMSRSRKRPNTAQVTECIDGVRTIITQTGRTAPKVILVTSAVEHEGKTTLAAQLAASLARAGQRTLILDGDLRHPNVHIALELDLRAGLPEVLRGELSADEVVQPTGVDGLFAVTGGSCDYAAITALSRPDSAKIVKHYRESFDHVVIDAGPVLAFADVLLLGQASDAAILVTMRDVSRVTLVGKAAERLRSVGVRVLGSVVNGVTDDGPRRMYASPVPT